MGHPHSEPCLCLIIKGYPLRWGHWSQQSVVLGLRAWLWSPGDQEQSFSVQSGP